MISQFCGTCWDLNEKKTDVVLTLEELTVQQQDSQKTNSHKWEEFQEGDVQGPIENFIWSFRMLVES